MVGKSWDRLAQFPEKWVAPPSAVGKRGEGPSPEVVEDLSGEGVIVWLASSGDEVRATCGNVVGSAGAGLGGGETGEDDLVVCDGGGGEAGADESG